MDEFSVVDMGRLTVAAKRFGVYRPVILARIVPVKRKRFVLFIILNLLGLVSIGNLYSRVKYKGSFEILIYS